MRVWPQIWPQTCITLTHNASHINFTHSFCPHPVTSALLILFCSSVFIIYWLLFWSSVCHHSVYLLVCFLHWFEFCWHHRVFSFHVVLFCPCWGSSVEGEGEWSRGEHLRQPLCPLPCSHPPSVTSDCPLSFYHPHLDEPPHKDRGLP